MSKQLWLRLNGSLEQGFEVSVDIRDRNQTHGIEAEGELPANPKLARCLTEWQQSYHNLPGVKRIILDEVIVEMISSREVCLQKRDALEQCFKDWLLSSSFRAIERQIQGKVSPDDALRIVIRTQDKRLHHLPWHLWDLVEEDYKHAEVALATRAKPLEQVRKPGEKVKVLAILGDSKGIDTESDCEQLKRLPNAEVQFLPKPPRQEISRQEINDHLWDQDWDILFFAGHSRTEQTQGRIYINSKDSLTIKELKYGLERAIARGLQLAIFNSCDGLGLAYELEQLHIPQLIVMREPVPDRVAQEFLKRFLTAFAGGESLYAAVRYARERLQGLEGEFPCASWLPVIVQNPAVVPPNWTELWQPPPEPLLISNSKQIRLVSFWQKLLIILATSTLVTGVVMGGRALGLLQPFELQAYDQLLQQRPQEQPDQRLALITITEEDFRLTEQQNRKGSLSDQALELVLKRLEPFKPRVIGLDVLRDFEANSKFTELQRLMRQDNFLSICLVGNSQSNPGTAPSPELPLKQIGFSNFALDQPYDVLRRHLLHMDVVGTNCSASDALSLKLALRYLESENITPKFTSQGYLQLGNVVFEPLTMNSGGYQRINHGGHQVLLNYRSVDDSLSKLVDLRFSLKQVLEGHPRLSEIRDRIVLIGVDAPSVKDYFLTPYTQTKVSRLPGVTVHAQMISQLLSAVLDGRPILRVWHLGYEIVWVWSWAVICGALIVSWRKSIYILFGLICAVFLLLYLFCYLLLTLLGLWVPLVPTALSILASSAVINYLIYRHKKTSITKSIFYRG
jgi:CHASE2 domain-containing sensor protein